MGNFLSTGGFEGPFLRDFQPALARDNSQEKGAPDLELPSVVETIGLALAEGVSVTFILPDDILPAGEEVIE